MKKLPENVKPYKKIDIFDEHSVPYGLLKDHSTKAGTWGKITLLEGKLLYRIQSNPIEEVELNPQKFGVVEPEVLHHVRVIGQVKFFVEFFKADLGDNSYQR